MTVRVCWTRAADTRIRRLRAEGANWDIIAAAFGVSRWSVIQRGRLLGAGAPLRPPPPPGRPDQRLADPRLTDPAREPLPAGHPVTWGLITAGTLLEGTAYPWPPLPLHAGEAG